MRTQVLTAVGALLLLPHAFGDVSKPRLITSVAKPVECIAPINIYAIDGKLVTNTYEIEPGHHSLVGRSSEQFSDCPRMQSTQSVDIPPLEYEFEAGKTYYIGLDRKSANQQNWSFVVWRVKDHATAEPADSEAP
jgi:hypothetical protein